MPDDDDCLADEENVPLEDESLKMKLSEERDEPEPNENSDGAFRGFVVFGSTRASVMSIVEQKQRMVIRVAISVWALNSAHAVVRRLASIDAHTAAWSAFENCDLCTL